MEKLNTELINKIWLTLSTCTYLFSNAEEENIPIVPENKTHEFLLKNFTINNAILDFYYSHTNRFFSEEEYEKIKKTGYVGRKEHTLKPYPLVIFGAYFNRVDLIIKLQSIIHQDVKERPKLNGNSVEHFSDLIPYFKKYAEGFKNGYENFEQNCINEYLPAFPDKNDYIYKVFEYLTKRIIFEHDWYNNHCGFTISRIVDGKKIDNSGEIVDAYENGQKQGFFYRAWSIVFSNNNLFAPLFEQKTKEALPPQQPEKSKPELTINQIALKYVYSEIQITRENGNKIAKEYGHNSGEKLFQRFTYYSSAANRKGKPTPCTPKKLDNKIKLIESIIELLPTDKQERAKDEVSILKKIYEAEYQ